MDLSKPEQHPNYYIVPDWWIRNDIYRTHKAYLRKHGGKRKYNPESKHHRIDIKRIKQWKDKWDILKIF